MERSIRQLAACIVLFTQLVVVWMGGPGVVSCMGCGDESSSVAAAADDEDSCCCGDQCCGCCVEHAPVPRRDSRPQHDECLSRIAVPAMATDTLRFAAADDVRLMQLPVAAEFRVEIVTAECVARVFGLPPPDPGPMRVASGVSITELLI